MFSFDLDGLKAVNDTLGLDQGHRFSQTLGQGPGGRVSRSRPTPALLSSVEKPPDPRQVDSPHAERCASMTSSSSLTAYEFLLPKTSGVDRLNALLKLSVRDFPREDIVQILRSALELALALGETHRAAQAELRLAQQLDGPEAAEYAQAAQTRFEQLGDGAGEALSVLRQAELLGQQPAQALTLFLIAAATAQDAQQGRTEAQAHRRAGDTYMQLADEAQAIKAYQQSLTASGRFEPGPEDVPLLLTLGRLQLRSPDLEGAWSTYSVLRHLTQNATTPETAATCAGLGELQLKRGNLEQALTLLEEATQLSAILGERRLEARLLDLLAQLADQQGNAERAAELFNRSLATADADAALDLYVDTLLNFAEHSLRRGRPMAAAPLLDRALELSWQAQLPSGEQRAQLLLTRLTAGQGDTVAALVHQQAWNDLERQELTRSQAEWQQVHTAQQQAELFLAVRRERQRVQRELETTRAALSLLGEQAEQWQETSSHDLESGARARRYGMEQLTRDFQRSLRAKTDLSLAIIGLDVPLLTQDIPAPLQSPLVLSTVVQLLQQSVRDTDTVARYDTHKFMVIFPETALEGAKLVLKRIVATVATHDWASLGLDAPLTVSGGLAGRGFIQGAQLLIEVADEQYYRVRRDGGNAFGVAE